MPAQYIIQKSVNMQYYFNLTAENNEKILTSEMYLNKSGAKKGILSVQANAPYDASYSKKQASDGQYYFTIKAANNEIIGTSEMYSTYSAMLNGIEAVKRVGPKAKESDQTYEWNG
jgi:hypothetical protein